MCKVPRRWKYLGNYGVICTQYVGPLVTSKLNSSTLKGKSVQERQLALLKYKRYTFLLWNKRAVAEPSVGHSPPCRPRKLYEIMNLEKSSSRKPSDFLRRENGDVEWTAEPLWVSSLRRRREEKLRNSAEGTDSLDGEKDYCSASARKKVREGAGRKGAFLLGPQCTVASSPLQGWESSGEDMEPRQRGAVYRREQTQRVNFLLPLEMMISFGDNRG